MSHDASPKRPAFSVVIPTRNTLELTLTCLESVFAAAAGYEGELEVVMVDDAGSDGTAEAVAQRYPRVQMLRNASCTGFTRAANLGLATTRGENLLLLNSDTEFDPGGWQILEESFRRRPDLGVVGAALCYPGGKPQWSGGPVPTWPWLFALASGLPSLLGRIPGIRKLRPVSGVGGGEVGWVTGAAMAFRRQVWQQIGPLNESFHLYGQDLDFCVRAHDAGWRVAVAEDLRVVHHHAATVKQDPRAVGVYDPVRMWPELVRWAGQRGGPARARRAALALQAGSTIRLLGLRLAWPWGDRETRRAHARAYRQAIGAVSREVRGHWPPTSVHSSPKPPRSS